MSTPARKTVQPTFGASEREEGPRQTTLGEPVPEGGPITITPEAYRKAYEEARAAGPETPVRITVPASLLGTSRPVESPVSAPPTNPRALAAEGAKLPPPKPTTGTPVPPELARSTAPPVVTRYSYEGLLYGDGPSLPDPDVLLGLGAFDWGRQVENPLSGIQAYIAHAPRGMSEEVTEPVARLLATYSSIRSRPLPRAPEGNLPSPAVLALVADEVRGDVLDLNDFCVVCARTARCPLPPFLPSEPGLEDLGPLIEDIRPLMHPGDARRRLNKIPFALALFSADSECVAGRLKEGFEGALLLPYVREAIAKVILEANGRTVERVFRRVLRRYEDERHAWYMSPKPGGPPPFRLPDLLRTRIEQAAAASGMTVEEYIRARVRADSLPDR
ncbi:MAG TPA: hypothetical protein VMV28_06710 [Thermoplasmata archaeon]|nr:hypothetical protein [Thermoplasmata archaeon]